jgi:hypothetical protein
LIEAKIITTYKGKIPKVKIVGGKGETLLSKKLSISGILLTASVKEAVTKAGGEVK